jgi:hypothetical protein
LFVLVSAFVNERLIQNTLFQTLIKQGHRSICPNYTPAGWFECDVFSITKQNYFVEHEIKLSVTDFKKDASKRAKTRWVPDTETKHERLSRKDPRGPRSFYFVVPEELADKIEIPAWAGLKIVSKWGKRFRLKTLKRAPALHKTPVNPDVASHVQGVFFWRFWTERQKRGS